MRHGSAGAPAAVLGCAIALTGCASPGDTAAPPLPSGVTSSAFDEGGAIPVRFTCDGEDVSPPLSWEAFDLPAAAIAVVVTDPDAGGFVHWVVGPLPMSTTSLPEGASADPDLPQGANDFGDVGWGGPCPPSGTHHYVFTVVSLSSTPPEPITAQAVLAAQDVQGGTLTATYTRP